MLIDQFTNMIETIEMYQGLLCGFLSIDFTGKILFANDYILQLLQIDELRGTSIQDISPQLFESINNTTLNPDKFLVPRAIESDFMVKGENVLTTMVHLKSDNKKIYLTVNPNRNTHKSKHQYQSNHHTKVSLDQTLINENIALKNKIALYKKNEEISRQISEVGRVGGWDISLINGKVFWSDVTKQIHEVNQNFESTVEKGIDFYKEGESRETIQNAVFNLIVYGTSFDVELQIITAQGNEKWVRAIGFAKQTKDTSVQLCEPFESMIPITSKRKTIGIYGTFQDIDKQKKLMIDLERINKKTFSDNTYLKSIVENDTFYVTKTDLEGNYTYINPCLCNVLEVNESDWIGRNSLGLIIPEDHQKCFDVITKCFENPNKSQWVILRKPTPKGVITNQWEFKILYDENGNFSEFLCIGMDITPLIKKQEELQKLLDITELQNKRLENFTHIVSHNIRSHVANLNGILSITDMDNDTERLYAHKLITEVVNSLDETIQNLNEIILIQSNHHITKTKISVKKELQRIIKIIQLMVDENEVKFHFNFKETELLFSNTAYFESIFLNLFTNAIKYKSLKRKPEISISITESDTHKIIEVTDNGLGIDLKRHKHKIFGMYKTFHGNADAKGMGLFIVKTQVEALGGKIDIESEVDRGTTFKIYMLNK